MSSAIGEQRGGSGDEDNTHERNEATDLFDAGVGFFEENRAGPASEAGGQEGNNGCICEGEV